jgi:hypothetical protein
VQPRNAAGPDPLAVGQGAGLLGSDRPHGEQRRRRLPARPQPPRPGSPP